MEKQELAQMTEQMLARMDASMSGNNKTMLAEILEKADANRKTDKE
jgi:hypothetical protein